MLFLINSVVTYLYEKLFIGWLSRKYQERQTMQKRKEFEKLLVDGAEAAATKNASRAAIDQEGEQLEGGNTEGPKGMQ